METENPWCVNLNPNRDAFDGKYKHLIYKHEARVMDLVENAKPWDVNMKEKREGLVETESARCENMKKKKYRVVES